MSNSLAIATVTATLKYLLGGALEAALDQLTAQPDKVDVSTVRPTPGMAGLTKKGVNVYLFQITPNAALRNDDLPTRRAGGEAAQRPRAAIDLHYLISFHGDDRYWEAQRVLGITLQTLHARPVLGREMISRIVAAVGASTDFDFMLKSDLADAVESIRLTLEPLELEEISKIWSVFFQTPYELSVVYRASVVVVEADEIAEPALPVRSVGARAIPIASPRIERVANVQANAPIVSDSALSIRGRGLRGDVTRVLVGGEPLDATVDHVGAAEIRADLGGLPAPLRAGVHGLQVAHMILLGDPPAPHVGPESNVVPFVLHPRITGVTKALTSETVDGVTVHRGTITVALLPDAGRAQRVVLLLNRTSPSAPPRAFAFEAKPRPSGPGDPLAASEVSFDVEVPSAGTYAVRVQVDGAESAIVPPDDDYAAVTIP